MASVYICKKKSCPAHGKEFTAIDPSAARRTTRRSVKCGACGQVAWWVKKVEEKTDGVGRRVSEV